MKLLVLLHSMYRAPVYRSCMDKETEAELGARMANRADDYMGTK